MPELKLTVWGDSNVGLVRKNNEDYISYFEPGDPQVIESMGRLYIVADGVGGAATGEVASKYATLKVLHAYFNQPALKPWERIKAGMKHANIALVEYIRQNAQARMATTMVAAAINGNECTIVNVGDSRAYLIRNQQVRQITQDHNLVNEMIRNGVLTEEQAKTAKVKNQLTSSLGGHEIFKADVFVEKLMPGDLLLLASDGLCRYAEELPIIQKIALSGTPEQVVNNGIQYARKSGGQDNITVMLIRVDEAVDSLPMKEDHGPLPVAVDLEEIVRDPLTMTARSPEQEEKLSAPKPSQALFKPDIKVAPLSAADARSIPGLNQAASDEELDDTGDLGKHPIDEEGETQTVTVDSVRLSEVVQRSQPVAPPIPRITQKAPASPPEKTNLVQRISVQGYIVLILIASMILVLLLVLAATFGSKYFEQRKSTPTPMGMVEGSVFAGTEEAPADETGLSDENSAANDAPPQDESPTAAVEPIQESSIPGICLAQVKSGDSLAAIFRSTFELPYDGNADYYYRICSGAGDNFDCQEPQLIDEKNNILTNWFIEIKEADQSLCQAKNGTWFLLP